MSHMRRPRRRRGRVSRHAVDLAASFARGWTDGKKDLYRHWLSKGHEGDRDGLTGSDWDWMYRHGVAWECCQSPVADATVEVAGQPQPAPSAAPASLELTEWSSSWLDSPNWPALPEWASPDCPHRTVDADGDVW